MQLVYSFIIPVYNRPEELKELLESLSQQDFQSDFEVVVVEDGSQRDASDIVRLFDSKLSIVYLLKENTGPGDSRNFGMSKATGNYFIILDSDCILPSDYLSNVDLDLREHYVDCYGGPDAAHASFSSIQKAINFAMTSVVSTGGIRGGKKSVGKFQPRSFNMGLSKIAFESTGGFGRIHPGEDPDLSIRLWKNGFSSKLITQAYVFHKRRIDFVRFFKQVKKFGTVRPILNKWHPHTASITYWFPTFFSLGFIAALIFLLFFPAPYNSILIGLYLLYFIAVFLLAWKSTKSLVVGALSTVAIAIQFIAYGYGFLKSTILVNFKRKKPQEIFPDLFF